MAQRTKGSIGLSELAVKVSHRSQVAVWLGVGDAIDVACLPVLSRRDTLLGPKHAEWPVM